MEKYEEKEIRAAVRGFTNGFIIGLTIGTVATWVIAGIMFW